MSQKAQLRREYLQKRKELSRKELDTRSSKVLSLFKQSFTLRQNWYVHIFLPIEKQNEINTWPFIEYLEHNGHYIVVSKSDLKSSSMTHYIYDKASNITKNKWGIPEPRSGQKVQESQIDLVLIPLLAFDINGNRIGYGKGYYDAFLAKCRNDCLKVGLSLVPPVDTIEGVESTDIKMDYCVSPAGLHTFGNLKK